MASLEDLTGKGGNLETNSPYQNGAAKLTTGNDNSHKAEIGFSVKSGLGTLGTFINSGGQLGYDYHKSSTDIDKAPAASIKLHILDTSGIAPTVKYLVYEAYGNMPGNPVVDTWNTVDIDSGNGTFWHNGLFGESNMAGNVAGGKTIADWATYFGDKFSDALIVGLSIGVGSYNLGQTAHFDGVEFQTKDHDLFYDFEAPQISAVPLPAALPLYGAGVALLGLMGWRRRKAAA
ncbi:MAG: hypothetical protein ABJN43_17945 [Sneathiella sp.]